VGIAMGFGVIGGYADPIFTGLIYDIADSDDPV